MKKFGKITFRVFTILVAVLAIGLMVFTIISVNIFDHTERNIFGYKAFIVLSDSMKKTDFAAGDVVIVKNVDPIVLKEGDIVTFISQNEDNYGELVTHKIRNITKTETGDDGFVTYGTTTNVDDETIVTYPYIIGKYSFHIPKAGLFFQFLKTTPGYIICILIPFLLLIGFQGFSTFRLFKNYRKEQEDDLKNERQQIIEERKKLEEMMDEIKKIKDKVDSD